MNNTLAPQNLQLEKDLIGLLLARSESFNESQKQLFPAIFYHEHHVEIYTAMQAIVLAGKKVNAYTVSEQLTITGKLKTIGGDDYLLKLQDNVSFSNSAIELGLNLFQLWIRRQIISGCQNAIKNSYDMTVDEFELLDGVRQNILEIHSNLNKTSKRTLSDITDSYVAEIIAAMNAGQKMQGIRSYIPSLDNRLGGLMQGNMIVIAGRPGTGKTALLIQMIVNICLKNDKKKFVVYSIEMTGEQLINRVVSCLMCYPYSDISSGKLPVDRHAEFSRWVKVIKNCISLEIIDNIADIDEIVMDLKAKYDTAKVDGVILDYLQLCRAKSIKGGNREQQVSYISSTIKTTAKELKLPFIALAQLNREAEKGPDKKPQLIHLRESGSMEQDADSVTFLYRPLYAGFTKNEDDEHISERECWLLTRKNRHGATGEDEVWCDITCNVFRDKDEYYEPVTTKAKATSYVPKDITTSNKVDDDLPF